MEVLEKEEKEYAQAKMDIEKEAKEAEEAALAAQAITSTAHLKKAWAEEDRKLKKEKEREDQKKEEAENTRGERPLQRRPRARTPTTKAGAVGENMG